MSTRRQGSGDRVRLLGCRLLLILLAVPVAGCAGRSGCDGSAGSAACTRVLFIGDSYTGVNDLPAMFADLAASGGHAVQTQMLADGGATFTDHAAAPATEAALTSTRWDVVVLQEQSQRPSDEATRIEQMYPAARQLVGMVRAAGARPVFFLTWARRDGWPEAGIPDYASMQAAVDQGYLQIAGEESATVAPVGVVWQTVLGEEQNADLWQSDGSHPTIEGTYLAACVFYVTIFRQSPSGLSYHAGLSDDQVWIVQGIAASIVLGDAARWGLHD